MTPQTMRHRADIDGLRAVAVVPVVLYHADLGFSGGFVGVDVFFVISGYLITAILLMEMEAGRFSLVGFWERRARRLFPALFVMLAVTAAAAAALMTPEDLAAFGRSAAATAIFAANLHFYSETGYFQPEAHLAPLLHTWSLAVEEQFYLAFPLLLLLGRRWLPGRWLVAAAAAGCLASFALAVRWTPWEGGAAAFFLPHPRAWELGVGALLALTVGPTRPAPSLPRGLAEALAAGGLAAILWAALAYDKTTLFPGWSAAVPVLGTAAVILAGAAAAGERTAAARLLSLGPMTAIGRLSYSLYLWHWPVLVFAAYGLIRPLSGLETAAALAASLALAWASWRFVETPVRRRRALASRRAVAAASVAAAAALLAAGGTLAITEGLPGRLPAELRPFTDRLALRADRGCGLDHRRFSPEDVCMAGAAGAEPSFALMGDSHAIDVAPGLFAAAERLGLAGWRFHADGAMPMPGRHLDGGDSRFTTGFLEFLRARPEIDRVIVSAFWRLHVTGYSYRHDGDYRVDPLCPEPSVRCTRESLERSLARLFEAFPDRRFVLLDDTPSGRGLHLPDHLRTVASRRGPPPGGVPRAEAEAEAALYRDMLAGLAAAHPNVTHLPVLLEALCGPALCPLFDAEGRPLYWDGDHLSLAGSLSLAPVLAAAFGDDWRILD